MRDGAQKKDDLGDLLAAARQREQAPCASAEAADCRLAVRASGAARAVIRGKRRPSWRFDLHTKTRRTRYYTRVHPPVGESAHRSIAARREPGMRVVRMCALCWSQVQTQELD